MSSKKEDVEPIEDPDQDDPEIKALNDRLAKAKDKKRKERVPLVPSFAFFPDFN